MQILTIYTTAISRQDLWWWCHLFSEYSGVLTASWGSPVPRVPNLLEQSSLIIYHVLAIQIVCTGHQLRVHQYWLQSSQRHRTPQICGWKLPPFHDLKQLLWSRSSLFRFRLFYILIENSVMNGHRTCRMIIVSWQGSPTDPTYGGSVRFNDFLNGIWLIFQPG